MFGNSGSHVIHVLVTLSHAGHTQRSGPPYASECFVGMQRLSTSRVGSVANQPTASAFDPCSAVP